jgi:condensin complex subunit 3
VHNDGTPASRFVARLLEWLIHGFSSKNKTVRFRAVSIISDMVSNLGEIEYVKPISTFHCDPA